jgi:metal-responsive CopG/Arc/MetJ family transcriptional regulator
VAKVLVSFEDALLRRIDRIAKERGLSRSACLAELARHDLRRARAPVTTEKARRALARLDHLFAGTPRDDSTAAIRDGRDAR